MGCARSMERRQVFARLNVLGVDLPDSEIASVLDLTNQTQITSFRREWLSSFFSVAQSELHRASLERYAEADNAMANISAGSFDDDIHTRVIQPLASAKKCYAYAEYLACIELCALHGEMLVNYLCSADRAGLETVMDALTDDDRKHILDRQEKGAFFADRINQTVRIRWLLAGNIIDNNDRDALGKVHGMRINYFHRWRPGNEDVKNDALDALTTISTVSAKYLELLDNQNNVARIRRYMAIVDAGSV